MGDREVEDKIDEEKEVKRKKPQIEGQPTVTTLRIRKEMREIEDEYIREAGQDHAHVEHVLITAHRRSMADSVRASPRCGKAWQASACLELGWSSGVALDPLASFF